MPQDSERKKAYDLRALKSTGDSEMRENVGVGGRLDEVSGCSRVFWARARLPARTWLQPVPSTTSSPLASPPKVFSPIYSVFAPTQATENNPLETYATPGSAQGSCRRRTSIRRTSRLGATEEMDSPTSPPATERPP